MIKWLNKEFKEVNDNREFTAKYQDDNDISVWYCTFQAGTTYEENEKERTSPYAGWVFPVTIKIGDNYPSTGPSAYFASHYNHPNIYNDGTVCI